MNKNCSVSLPEQISGTGINESVTITIKPCDLCHECYIKGNKFWCNHCCDLYTILEELEHNNKELPLGALMGIAMRTIRGKVSGGLVEKILRLLRYE